MDGKEGDNQNCGRGEGKRRKRGDGQKKRKWDGVGMEGEKNAGTMQRTCHGSGTVVGRNPSTIAERSSQDAQR